MNGAGRSRPPARSSSPAAASDAQVDPALTAHIEAALGQVGYHGDEAAVIAQRLTSSKGDDEDDPASRTELAMKLKARTRLGEDAAKARKPDAAAAHAGGAGCATTSCG